MKNEVADHVMDDACAFATIYLWQKLCVVEAGGDMGLVGVGIGSPQGFCCFFPIRLALRAHPSLPLEQLRKNEVADHVMDDACACATIYLWQKLCVVEAGWDMALEGVA